MSSTAQELFDAFMSTHTCSVPHEIREQVSQVETLFREAEEQRRAILALQDSIAALEQRYEELFERGRNMLRSFDHETATLLFPKETVLRDMQGVVQMIVTTLFGPNESSLSVELQELITGIMRGDRHAHTFSPYWTVFGEETGNAIFNALLAEAGVTPERIAMRYELATRLAAAK